MRRISALHCGRSVTGGERGGNDHGFTAHERQRLRTGALHHGSAIHRHQHLDRALPRLGGERHRAVELVLFHDEARRGNQQLMAIHGLRLDPARVGFFPDRSHAAIQVEFAGTAIIIQAIGDIAVLLGLNDDGVGADGMDRACIDVDHFAGAHIQPVQHVFGLIGFDGQAEHLAIDAGTQTEANLGAFHGASHIPTFRFAAGLADECAPASSGCTCTLSFWRGKRNLMSSGKRSACGAASPVSAAPYCAARSRNVCPASGPLATRHSSPVSQTSPIGSASTARLK